MRNRILRRKSDKIAKPSGLKEGVVASRSTFCYDLAMTKTIPQRELRNENAKVIDAVLAGTSFVVTRNGVPVAELHPVRTARRSFVAKIDLLALAAGGPHVDAEMFRMDLDHLIDQEV